jgi:hypothetical protein
VDNPADDSAANPVAVNLVADKRAAGPLGAGTSPTVVNRPGASPAIAEDKWGIPVAFRPVVKWVGRAQEDKTQEGNLKAMAVRSSNNNRSSSPRRMPTRLPGRSPRRRRAHSSGEAKAISKETRATLRTRGKASEAAEVSAVRNAAGASGAATKNGATENQNREC